MDEPAELEEKLKEIQARGTRLKASITGLNRVLVEPRLEEIRKEYARVHERWVAAKQQERLF
jgi:hypothetical protein